MNAPNSPLPKMHREHVLGRLWQLTVLVTFLTAWMNYARAADLTLDSYLGEVSEKNQGLKGSEAISRGAGFRAIEGKVLLTPRLEGEMRFDDNEIQQVNPLFQGTKTKTNSYSLGVSQETTFGLRGKLSYNVVNTQIVGAGIQFVPEPNFYTASPVLTLTQSLWRNGFFGNGFGGEVRANQILTEARALALSYRQSYEVKRLRWDAERAYWSLALARENVRVQQDSLSRFERIRNLYQRRSNLGLSDRADLLQSAAAVDQQKVGLQVAINEERVAARQFNTVRGMDGDLVNENLLPISSTTVRNIPAPERAEFREDVRATQEDLRVAVAEAQIGGERNSPTLDAFASISLNGRDPTFAGARSESMTTQYPYNSFGVRFTAPLDIGKLAKSREGFKLEETGADLKVQRALYDQQREWNDLTQRLAESKTRLELARSLEETQKEKLEYERSRHTRGRTTTFQVLQFEQDYANSQLSHIQAKAAVLNLIAQMKTFGGNS